MCQRNDVAGISRYREFGRVESGLEECLPFMGTERAVERLSFRSIVCSSNPLTLERLCPAKTSHTDPQSNS